MGCAEGAHGGARVRAVLDLSNRPHFESDLPLDEENVGAIEYGKPYRTTTQGCLAVVLHLALSTSPTLHLTLSTSHVQMAFSTELDEVPPSDDDAPSPWDALCGNVLSCEMLFHVYNSLTLEMRSSCHLELCEDDGTTGHTLDLALAAANAYGAALARAVRVDPRRKGKVASSKGTLSK
eukprot:COSAG02_NODE_4796_length_4968_cov_3.098172_2_plen_179_part_00